MPVYTLSHRCHTTAPPAVLGRMYNDLTSLVQIEIYGTRGLLRSHRTPTPIPPPNNKPVAHAYGQTRYEVDENKNGKREKSKKYS